MGPDPNPNPNRPTGQEIIWKLALSPFLTLTDPQRGFLTLTLINPRGVNYLRTDTNPYSLPWLTNQYRRVGGYLRGLFSVGGYLRGVFCRGYFRLPLLDGHSFIHRRRQSESCICTTLCTATTLQYSEDELRIDCLEQIATSYQWIIFLYMNNNNNNIFRSRIVTTDRRPWVARAIHSPRVTGIIPSDIISPHLPDVTPKPCNTKNLPWTNPYSFIFFYVMFLWLINWHEIYLTERRCCEVINGTSLDYALNNSARTIRSMVTTQILLETKLVIGAYKIITKPLNKAIFKYFRYDRIYSYIKSSHFIYLLSSCQIRIVLLTTA